MITYVIPTLWKDPNIYKTFKSFSSINDPNAKMVVINNTNIVKGYTDPRIEFVNLGYNSFVNSAWNLGVHKSQTEYVCLLNDDIIIDLKTLHNFIIEQKPEFTGFSYLNREGQLRKDSIQLVKYNEDIMGKYGCSVNKMPLGFGQFMLFKKNNWLKIPDSMKIFHGDDIIYYYHTLILGIQVSLIDGFKIEGNQSVTAQDWWESDIAINDTKEYIKWLSKNDMETVVGVQYPESHCNYKIVWKKDDFDFKWKIEEKMNKRIKEW